MSKDITAEWLGEASKLAYRKAGYEVVTFGDGSVGVLKATRRQCAVVNELQRLVLEKVQAAAKD